MNSQNPNIKKSRLNLILVLVAFALPVVIAKLVLDNHWYQEGVTNKGELLTSPVNLSNLNMDNPHQGVWQIIYMPPASCDSACQQRLYILKQSHTALGKYQDRVTPVVILGPNTSTDLAQGMEHATASAALHSMLNKGEILVVDPLGNLVMRYDQVDSQEAQIAQGKDLLADLRKMLKLSRIG